MFFWAGIFFLQVCASERELKILTISFCFFVENPSCMKISTIVVKRTVLLICYYMMICYEIIPLTILYFLHTTRKSCWTSQGLQKNLSCHNLCVLFVTNEEAAMCLYVMHEGAEEGSNFLQSSKDFVLLVLCAVCYVVILYHVSLWGVLW